MVFVLVVFAAIIGWLIVNFLSRKRPQIIEVIRKEQVSLLKIDSQVEKDIKLEYKGRSINSFQGSIFFDQIKYEKDLEDGFAKAFSGG
ncbi:MAG: hypothetical protein HC886_11320 [Leptolyngbyaceae cyanobacterium SM1_1_3]|nr:hypothetical protein [Leptolyngbyaceae cyanobacterium SM1_1_3]